MVMTDFPSASALLLEHLDDKFDKHRSCVTLPQPMTRSGRTAVLNPVIIRLTQEMVMTDFPLASVLLLEHFNDKFNKHRSCVTLPQPMTRSGRTAVLNPVIIRLTQKMVMTDFSSASALLLEHLDDKFDKHRSCVTLPQPMTRSGRTAVLNPVIIRLTPEMVMTDFPSASVLLLEHLDDKFDKHRSCVALPQPMTRSGRTAVLNPVIIWLTQKMVMTGFPSASVLLLEHLDDKFDKHRSCVALPQPMTRSGRTAVLNPVIIWLTPKMVMTGFPSASVLLLEHLDDKFDKHRCCVTLLQPMTRSGRTAVLNPVIIRLTPKMVMTDFPSASVLLLEHLDDKFDKHRSCVTLLQPMTRSGRTAVLNPVIIWLTQKMVMTGFPSASVLLLEHLDDKFDKHRCCVTLLQPMTRSGRTAVLNPVIIWLTPKMVMTDFPSASVLLLEHLDDKFDKHRCCVTLLQPMTRSGRTAVLNPVIIWLTPKMDWHWETLQHSICAVSASILGTRPCRPPCNLTKNGLWRNSGLHCFCPVG